MTDHHAFVVLGSNIDKERMIVSAVRGLASEARLDAVSAVYESAAVGRPDQPSFLNAAVRLVTGLPPLAVRDRLLRPLEQALGRHRTGDRYAPRTIDLDLVLYDQMRRQLDGLRLPDPDLLRFAHVAVPVSELDPGFRHPETGERLAAVAERLAALSPPLRRRSEIDLRPYLLQEESADR